MRFEFRPALALVAASGFAILVCLGVWQLQRRAWKLDLIARSERLTAAAPISFDAALAQARAGDDVEYMPVFLQGVFAHDLEAHVFGTLDGAAGVYVFTPLDAPDTDGGRRFVYVNRGFAPQAFRDPGTRRESAPAGEVVVAGLLRRPEAPAGLARFFRPGDQPAENLWFARDPARLAAHHGIEAAPFYIDSYGDETSGTWPKGGVTRLDFPNRHLEYALTWFGLAAALLGVYLAMSLRRR